MHNYVAAEPAEEEADPEKYVENIKSNMDVNICPYIEANPETEFYVFFPPYSILYWNDVLQEKQMEAVIREYEYIAQRLFSYGNVRVFFFPNQKWIVCNLDNYADYSHYQPVYDGMLCGRGMRSDGKEFGGRAGKNAADCGRL